MTSPTKELRINDNANDKVNPIIEIIVITFCLKLAISTVLYITELDIKNCAIIKTYIIGMEYVYFGKKYDTKKSINTPTTRLSNNIEKEYTC
jgi:hypothetical protein